MARSIHDKAVTSKNFDQARPASGKASKADAQVQTASPAVSRAEPIKSAASVISGAFTRAMSTRNSIQNLLDIAVRLEESLVRVGALPYDTLGATYRSIQQQIGSDAADTDVSENVDYPLRGLESIGHSFHSDEPTLIEALDLARSSTLSVLAMLTATVDGTHAYTLPLTSPETDDSHDEFLSNNALGRRVLSYSTFVNNTVNNIRSATAILQASITGHNSPEDLKREQPSGINSVLVDMEEQIAMAICDLQHLFDEISTNLL